MASFNNIPTNIISGFLGAGKTTAIQHLIKHKPPLESWAIVVNEFGQIGVDGKLLQNDGVAVKEIPGGCLCCVASQSFNVGLNQIIKQHRPQRIIIEPTGLGHPKKLIDTLSSEFYESVLDLKAVINLLDARNLSEPRYLQHETFMSQIAMADVLVANKLDQYTEKDREAFYQFVNSFDRPKAHIEMLQQAKINIDWLDIKHDQQRNASLSSAHSAHSHNNNLVTTVGFCWQIIEGHADGYNSISWQINNSIVFNQQDLISWLNSLRQESKVDRIKGIISTENGWLSINMTEHESEILNSDPFMDNILEIISFSHLQAEKLDAELRLSCLAS
jgi:G3E family GTPase